MSENNEPKEPTVVRIEGDTVGPDEDVTAYTGQGPVDASVKYNSVQGGTVTTVKIDGIPQGDITSRTDVGIVSGGEIIGVHLSALFGSSRKKEEKPE